MSWLYSQALVAAYSVDTSLDGAPCALSNGTPTQRPSWLPAKTTDACRLSRSGMTFKPLTAEHGEAVLMSFLAAFPAKTSAQPEREQVSTENEAACGRTWPESLAKFDPATRSWRTPQCLLFEDSTECLETFPRWGMMRDGECFHAEMRVEFTYENESGLSLPTPRNCTAMQAQITENTALARFPNLETVLARLTIPTLGKNEGRGTSQKRYLGSEDFRGAKMSEGLRTCETDPIYLNPLFAELVMMWPLGWTDLRALGTDKFRQWQHSHGAF
jgi:hypothetical protein